jgi:CheY-like chemotaxis protein
MRKNLILVVDDDEDIRSSVCDVLTIYNYDILLAENGKVALEVLSKTDSLPGLIILDLMMPVMDGKAFLDHIALNHQDSFAKIPIIIFTAKSSYPAEDTIPLSVKKIRKPFDLKDLLKMIEDSFQAKT